MRFIYNELNGLLKEYHKVDITGINNEIDKGNL